VEKMRESKLRQQDGALLWSFFFHARPPSAVMSASGSLAIQIAFGSSHLFLESKPNQCLRGWTSDKCHYPARRF
jgi:hypothetical protein